MSKKKSQIDRALESLETELSTAHRDYSDAAGSLQAKYQGRCEGLEASIKALRQQAARVPKRREKPIEIVSQ